MTRYIQAGDESEPGQQQTLEIESMNRGAGTFIKLSTRRWCFENDAEIDEFAAKLKAALLVDVLPTN